MCVCNQWAIFIYVHHTSYIIIPIGTYYYKACCAIDMHMCSTEFVVCVCILQTFVCHILT